MGHTEISTSTVWRVWLGLETGVSPTHSVFAACVALEHSLILSRSHNSHGTSPQFSAWKGGEIIRLFTQLTAENYTRNQKQSGTLAGVDTGPNFWHFMFFFFFPHTSTLTNKFTTGSNTRAVRPPRPQVHQEPLKRLQLLLTPISIGQIHSCCFPQHILWLQSSPRHICHRQTFSHDTHRECLKH